MNGKTQHFVRVPHCHLCHAFPSLRTTGVNLQLMLLLCRFYFRNWHGLAEKEPVVTRHALRIGSGAEQVTSPLLEMTSLEYLFAQVIFFFLQSLKIIERFIEIWTEEMKKKTCNKIKCNFPIKITQNWNDIFFCIWNCVLLGFSSNQCPNILHILSIFTRKQDAILSKSFKLYVLVPLPGEIWFCEWLDMFGCSEGRGRDQSL